MAQLGSRTASGISDPRFGHPPGSRRSEFRPDGRPYVSTPIREPVYACRRVPFGSRWMLPTLFVTVASCRCTPGFAMHRPRSRTRADACILSRASDLLASRLTHRVGASVCMHARLCIDGPAPRRRHRRLPATADPVLAAPATAMQGAKHEGRSLTPSGLQPASGRSEHGSERPGRPNGTPRGLARHSAVRYAYHSGSFALIHAGRHTQSCQAQDWCRSAEQRTVRGRRRIHGLPWCHACREHSARERASGS